ncbi:MAG: nuclear transport factor 2 family protein [Treponema sp.]|jgi:hypothetical protein|nr:nuclear transport factor 2 family protein [Treponema sp.]
MDDYAQSEKIKQHETIIKNYFNSWITKNINIITKYFDDEIVYSECYGPEYHGINEIKIWFNDWQKENTVLEWTIQRNIHQNNTVVVEWFFKCNCNETIDNFNGVSIIEFSEDDKIKSIKEFQSKAEHYFPYKNIEINSK